MVKTLINGIETDSLSSSDRGLQYGDGLFETIALRSGAVEYWEAHYQRLSEGCQKLAIKAPSEALLLSEIGLLRRSVRLGASEYDFTQNGVIKIIITRGVGERGYFAANSCEPTRILSLAPAPVYPSDYEKRGVKLKICRTRLSSNSTLAGIKHLNRLEQVLARAEWGSLEESGIAEGIMLDNNDYIIEGVMSNLIFTRHSEQQQSEILTPDLSNSGVSGVMRQQIIDRLKKEGKTVTVRPIHIDELITMDAMLCCNSIIKSWRVQEVDGVKKF